MTRYITLLTFTQKGAEEIHDSAERAHRFDKLAKKAGVTVEAQYWTLGAHDGVLILSADHEKRILRLLAELAAGGNVRTDTMRAFTDKEFTDLLD
jgi:uncharacterized protein with GYD domain